MMHAMRLRTAAPNGWLLGCCGLFLACNAVLGIEEGQLEAGGAAGNAGTGGTGGDDPAGGSSGDCPAAYFPAGDSGSCYRVVFEPASWTQAEAECEASGAHLVVLGEAVADVDEHFLVHDLSSVEPTWLGLSDRAEDGSFRWVTGTPLDLGGDRCFWADGEPSHAGAAGCVEQRAVACGDWYEVSCDALRIYVCEYDGLAADPSAS
jgi:hypothetical protein